VIAGSESPPSPRVAWPARLISRLAAGVLIVAMVGLLGFTVAQVLDRYLLKSSFNAHDQFARLCLVVLTFVGIAIGVRDRVNVRIELIGHLGSARLRKAVEALLDLVMLLVAAFLVGVSYRMLEIGASQPILGTPFTYEAMYLALMSGMGLAVVFLGCRLLARMTSGRLAWDTAPDAVDDHRA